MINRLINLLRKWRVVQHLLFWAASFYALLGLFASSNHLLIVDIIYTIAFHITLVVPVYINLLFLIPKILSMQKYDQYVGALLLLWIGGIGFNYIMFEVLVDLIFPGFYIVSYYNLWEIAKFLFVFLALTSLLKLSKGWFRISEMERQQLHLELQSLKAQINPHFLFNSLTGIYQLARKKSGNTPKTVLKLAELLRYMLYESEKNLIPLETELQFVRNYFELQQLRSSNYERIKLEIDSQTENLIIAPLLFTPLVENCFKHGFMRDSNNGFVECKIEVANNTLSTTIVNNLTSDHTSKKQGGIGLKNIQKRLQLIYPSKHTFCISNSNNTFEIRMTIELEKNTK